MARYSEKRRAAIEATLQSEVLRVATAILREEGYTGLTMDRVAREIGVSRGTLYNYFADADAVLQFVEEKTFEPLRLEMVRIVAGSSDTEEKLEAVARTTFDFLYRDRALALALFAVKELHGPRAEMRVRHRNAILDVVENIIKEGISAGTLRNVPSRLASEIFLGVMTGFIEAMLYSGEFRQGADLTPGMMDVLSLGLRSGVRGA